MNSQFRLAVLIALLLLVVTIISAVGSGSVNMSFQQVIDALIGCSASTEKCAVNPIHEQIIWDIRLPRILMATITGAGLSVTGAILQSVTRNPLADPYLFGISSGSALGAVVVMSSLTSAMITVTAGALLGGAFSVILMLTLAGRAAIQVEKLLLSGVAVSFMLSALTSLILYNSGPEMASTLLFWMMGSFSNSQWSELILPSIILFVGITLFFIYRRWLVVIQAGDESALTLGIPVNRLRLFMLIICSSITAVLVAHVGGIGFVGLMIPHICRFMVGAQIHRVLIMSLLVGGIFMVWVDIVARTLMDYQVLPIGIVTSALGSFFFFVILKRRREQAS